MTRNWPNCCTMKWFAINAKHWMISLPLWDIAASMFPTWFQDSKTAMTSCIKSRKKKSRYPQKICRFTFRKKKMILMLLLTRLTTCRIIVQTVVIQCRAMRLWLSPQEDMGLPFIGQTARIICGIWNPVTRNALAGGTRRSGRKRLRLLQLLQVWMF